MEKVKKVRRVLMAQKEQMAKKATQDHKVLQGLKGQRALKEQMEKKEKKETASSITVDAASNKLIRQPSNAADKIIDDILEGKEHAKGGTFDNHIVSLVACCIKKDKKGRASRE